jgi:hypothetical protein
MVNISQVLIGLEEQMRSGLPVRFALELAFIKLTAMGGASDIGDLLKKIETLGRRIEGAGGAGVQSVGGGGGEAAEPRRAPASPSAVTPRVGERPARAMAVPVMQEPAARAVEYPKIVPAEVRVPGAPRPLSATDSGSISGVSEASAIFQTGLSNGAGPALDDEPGAAGAALRVSAPADPKAWLREALGRDPSLAQAVATIKEVFAAREISLDGVPLG